MSTESQTSDRRNDQRPASASADRRSESKYCQIKIRLRKIKIRKN